MVATLTRAQQTQLENKQEQVFSNLDKAPLVFSKKHSFILHEQLQDFYTVRTRRPITDDKALVQINVEPSSGDVVCEPAQVTLDIRQQSFTIRVVYRGSAEVQDADFLIEHRVYSSEFEFHNIVLPLKCYKLGQRFKEVHSAGADLSLQLGHQAQADLFAHKKYGNTKDAPSENSKCLPRKFIECYRNNRRCRQYNPVLGGGPLR